MTDGAVAAVAPAAASGVPLAAGKRQHYLWELRPYFRQVAGQLVLGSLAGIMMNTAVVLPAILLGRAIDAVHALARGETDGAAVTWAALLYLAGVAATEAPRVGKRWWLMTANARIRASLRADCLRGVLRWPMERLHRTPIGDLMARIMADVEVLGVGVREFTIETWDTLLFSLSLVVALLAYDAGLAGLAFLPVPAALLLSHITGRWVQRRTTAARESNSSLTAAIQEQLSGVRVLRLFGRAGSAVERVAALSDRYASANLAAVRLKGGLQPVYSALVTGGVVFVVWIGGLRVIEGAMSLGSFVAFLELYLRFVNRGFRIPQLLNSIQTGGAAYERVRPLLAPPLGVAGEPPLASFRPGLVTGASGKVGERRDGYGRFDGGHSPLPERGALALAFQAIRLQYPGAAGPALDGVSFDVPAGSLVGVTGPVGSGKSALARAALGLYPVKEGKTLIAGLDVEVIPRPALAARVGYLPQDGYLFSGTVRENVLLRPAEEQESLAPLGRALSLAALDEDLRAFPAGVDTQIGELGVRVSGGQRQRISLARAVAGSHAPSMPGSPGADQAILRHGEASSTHGPGLLVLDDPFSAVDVDTELRIVRALREAFGPEAPPEQRATVLLCSHRLASFPLADRVVVLDAGRVVEEGTPANLVEAGGLYARIYAAQRRAEGEQHHSESQPSDEPHRLAASGVTTEER